MSVSWSDPITSSSRSLSVVSLRAVLAVCLRDDSILIFDDRDSDLMSLFAAVTILRINLPNKGNWTTINKSCPLPRLRLAFLCLSFLVFSLWPLRLWVWPFQTFTPRKLISAWLVQVCFLSESSSCFDYLPFKVVKRLILSQAELGKLLPLTLSFIGLASAGKHLVRKCFCPMLGSCSQLRDLFLE